MLRSELESIVHSDDDSYLLHEHLEDINEPVYFHTFAERASRAGLQYLGEADFGVMSVENFPEHIQGMLQSVSRDTVELEQYMDFLRNRAFRQTLLCHKDIRVERTPVPRSLLRMRVASSGQAEGTSLDLHARDQTVFRRRNATLTTTDPVVRAAMFHLRQVWPASVPFNELSSIARSMASGHPVAVEADLISTPSEQLASMLLRCFATSMVDLNTANRPFLSDVTERPVASLLARTQSQHTPQVTNLLHERVPLDDFQCQVLRACDGTRNRDELIQTICDNATRGDLVIFNAGKRLVEGDDLHRGVADLVPSILHSLARQALLIG